MKRRKMERSAGAAGAVVHADAAGIDIGATEVYVAVPEGRDGQAVRRFDKFTGDLYQVARWLKQCRVRTVAMESTGVYWIPLHQILEAWGFEVCLVNAAHVRHVPGRKSDVQDCRWLQSLHTAGLLRASFRPPQAICTLRTLLRHREALSGDACTHQLRMHKALELMNLQVQHVLSDITGVSGLAIIDAILAGERDPQQLAQLRDGRVRASADTIARSLVGDYREEHLFTLRQSLEFFRFYQAQIATCDQRIEQHLLSLEARAEPGAGPAPKPRPRQPNFDLHHHLHRALGVDLTAVPGINVMTAHTVLAEVGPDLSRFRSAAAFASWACLCPRPQVSGGRLLSHYHRPQPPSLGASLAPGRLRLAPQPFPFGRLLPPHARAPGCSQGPHRRRP